MKNPQVTVIMATYNGMPYLKQAVDSILPQTFTDFDFIIVDDHSSDKTIDYLKSLNDRRLRIIINQKRLGLARSLNKAISVAKGNYIARMDADDVSLPNRLKSQLDFLKKNPSIDLCGCWVKTIDEQGKAIGSVHNPLSDREIKVKNNFITAVLHPTWFAKRKVFVQLKGYDPRWDMVEDYEFLLRAKNFKMANIDKELLLWRSWPNRRSQKDIQRMYEKSLQVKWKHFVQGDFGFWYLPLLLRSFISTYFFPTWLKIFLNKKASLR